jgi:hypothetical protein
MAIVLELRIVQLELEGVTPLKFMAGQVIAIFENRN